MTRLPAALVAGFLALAPLAAGAAASVWSPAGDMAQEHIDHTATLLADGRVLVVGGHQYNSSTPSGVEIFEPAANRWSPGPPPPVARAGQAAVRLDDGRVLVVGGVRLGPGGPGLALASADLFDPRAGTWSAAAPMSTGRYHPTLTVLPDSRVLVAGGGDGAEQAVASAEVYDPGANRWSPVPAMSTPRQGAAAVLLHTGQVLVAGGEPSGTEEASLSSAELFDYQANRWIPAPAMHQARASAAIAVLGDGSALVAGGFDYAGGFLLATNLAEYYRPATSRWYDAPPLHLARGGPGYAVLDGGSLLVVGGQARTASIQAETTGELLNPATLQWTQLPSMGQLRSGPTVTALGNGRGLVAGGGHETISQVFARVGPAPSTESPLMAEIKANSPLLVLTGLLALLTVGQLAWRSRRQADGGR